MLQVLSIPDKYQLNVIFNCYPPKKKVYSDNDLAYQKVHYNFSRLPSSIIALLKSENLSFLF